jgi:hypothetical protein
VSADLYSKPAGGVLVLVGSTKSMGTGGTEREDVPSSPPTTIRSF